MFEAPWIVVSVVAVLAVVGLAVLLIKRGGGEKADPDYRVFFIIGICWLPMGIATDNPAFIILGLVFMALGLANHDKWQEQVPLTPNKKRAAYILAIVTGLLVLALVAASIYTNVVP